MNAIEFSDNITNCKGEEITQISLSLAIRKVFSAHLSPTGQRYLAPRV